MKVVMILPVRGRGDLLDAHLSFHLNTGVDLVVAALDDDELGASLEPFVRDGGVVVVEATPEGSDLDQRTRLAHIAATEYGADWLIDSDLGEFWWPRAESLPDALVAIPPRYTVVQALVRSFLPAEDGGPRTTRRELGSPLSGPLELGDWLRPVYRASPTLTLVPRAVVPEPWRVPLRAWYPIEVFRFPDDERGVDTDSGTLVTDTRLVDAFARLRETGELLVPVPDIVDDAAFAVECAALGEADFGPIEAHIADLEARIAALEAKFWPSVRRALRRLVPRRR